MKNLVEDKLAGFVDEKLNGEYDVRITRDDAGIKVLVLGKEVPVKFWDDDILFGEKDTKVYSTYIYVYEDDETLFVQTFLPNGTKFRIDTGTMVVDKDSFVWNRFRVSKSLHTVEQFLEEEILPELKNRF